MLSIETLRNKRADIDKLNKYIYLGHFKAGITSARNFALKGRSIRPSSKKKYLSKQYSLEQYEKMLKFTIVRNPYDRVLSAFYFLQRSSQHFKIAKNTDFKKWVKEVFKIKGTSFNQHFKPMYPRMIYEGKIWLDYIAKLENINNDWKYIADKCDLNPIFPRENYNNFKQRNNINRFNSYDDECIEIVYNIYKDDIDKLGYSFS